MAVHEAAVASLCEETEETMGIQLVLMKSVCHV